MKKELNSMQLMNQRLRNSLLLSLPHGYKKTSFLPDKMELPVEEKEMPRLNAHQDAVVPVQELTLMVKL